MIDDRFAQPAHQRRVKNFSQFDRSLSRRGGLLLFGERVSHFQRESGRVGVRDV